MAGKKWSETEVEILKNHYKKDWDELLEILPDRTKASIKLKMNALGLSKKLLGEDEKQYILDHYKDKTSREIAKDLGLKSKTAVLNFLRSKGLQRLSNEWEGTNIKSGVTADGHFVEITYEMKEKVD